MIKITFKNSEKLKIHQLSRRSRCLALVTQSQCFIQQLRDMKISWNAIANHLGISVSSLRNALHQINAQELVDKHIKSNTTQHKLIFYFSDETEKNILSIVCEQSSTLNGVVNK